MELVPKAMAICRLQTSSLPAGSDIMKLLGFFDVTAFCRFRQEASYFRKLLLEGCDGFWAAPYLYVLREIDLYKNDYTR